MMTKQRASATESALPNGMLNRRKLLTNGPIAAAAAAYCSTGGSALAAPSQADPLVAMVEEWKAVFQAWEDETYKPGSGDADTPECLRLEAIREGLTEQIEATRPVSPEGVMALLEFAWICDGGDYGFDYLSVKKCVMRNIMDFQMMIEGRA